MPRITHLLSLALSIALLPATVLGDAASLASQYSLTQSTQLAFPSAATEDVTTFATTGNEWSLSRGKIQNGASALAFVDDPFPDPSLTTPAGPVLKVTYTKGVYGATNSGSQFISFWNGSHQSVVLSYQVAFDKDFDWTKGGKVRNSIPRFL